MFEDKDLLNILPTPNTFPLRRYYRKEWENFYDMVYIFEKNEIKYSNIPAAKTYLRVTMDLLSDRVPKGTFGYSFNLKWDRHYD